MSFRYSVRSNTERKIKRNLDALDAAVLMFRQNGKDSWAADITDVRDFIARSRAYYERQATRHMKILGVQNAREVAQVMWDEVKRKK